MDAEEAVVGVYQHEDGVNLVGTSVGVEALPERFDAGLKNIAQLTPDFLLGAGAAFHSLSVTQAQNGRWVKLPAESATTLRQAGISASTKDGLLTGAARRRWGRSCPTCGSSRSPSPLGRRPWSWRPGP